MNWCYTWYQLKKRWLFYGRNDAIVWRLLLLCLCPPTSYLKCVIACQARPAAMWWEPVVVPMRERNLASLQSVFAHLEFTISWTWSWMKIPLTFWIFQKLNQNNVDAKYHNDVHYILSIQQSFNEGARVLVVFSPVSPTGLHVVRTGFSSFGRGHTLHILKAKTTVPITTKFWTNENVSQTKRIAKFCSNRFCRERLSMWVKNTVTDSWFFRTVHFFLFRQLTCRPQFVKLPDASLPNSLPNFRTLHCQIWHCRTIGSCFSSAT